MNRILCSTGALIGRPNGRDYTLLNECAKRLDCDGFEFMYFPIISLNGSEEHFRSSEGIAKGSAFLQSLFDYSSSSEHSDKPCMS